MTKKLIFLTTFITFITVLIMGLPVTAHAESPDIKPTQDYVVNDYANVLSDKTKALIHQKENFYESKKEQPQVVVLTIKDTDGKSLSDWTNELVQKPDWHFGNREYRNAVLIVFAKNNGKNNVAIKSASGLNKTLSHDEIMRLLHNNQNALKSQDTNKIDSGIYNLFSDTTNVIDTLYGYNKTSNADDSDDSDLALIVVTALLFVMVLGLAIIIIWLTIKRNKMSAEKSQSQSLQQQKRHNSTSETKDDTKSDNVVASNESHNQTHSTYNYNTTTTSNDDSSSGFLSGLLFGSMFSSQDDANSGSSFGGSSFGSDDSSSSSDSGSSWDFGSSGDSFDSFDDGGGFDGGDSGDF